MIRPTPDPRMSRSLEYGLAMLECFTPTTPSLGVAELAEKIGIGRSTAHRYAMTLVMLGYLEQDAKRKYRLSTRAHEPGRAAIAIRRQALPAEEILGELRDWTGHTVGMGTLHDTRAVYLYRLLGHRRGQHEADMELRTGASVPLHSSALGKALLAALPDEKRSALIGRLTLSRDGPNAIQAKRGLAEELEEIRATGIACDDEELAVGVRAVAVPIAGTGAATVEAMGPVAIEVTASASAGSMRALRSDVAPLLLRAAERVSRAGESVA